MLSRLFKGLIYSRGTYVFLLFLLLILFVGSAYNASDVLFTAGKNYLVATSHEGYDAGTDTSSSDVVDYDLNFNTENSGVGEVDYIPPLLDIHGERTMDIFVNDIFYDPGASAYDDRDGNITNRIVVIGQVDTSFPGEYFLIYSVSDMAGNLAEGERRVRVRSLEGNEEPTLPDDTYKTYPSIEEDGVGGEEYIGDEETQDGSEETSTSTATTSGDGGGEDNTSTSPVETNTEESVALGDESLNVNTDWVPEIGDRHHSFIVTEVSSVEFIEDWGLRYSIKYEAEPTLIKGIIYPDVGMRGYGFEGTFRVSEESLHIIPLREEGVASEDFFITLTNDSGDVGFDAFSKIEHGEEVVVLVDLLHIVNEPKTINNSLRITDINQRLSVEGAEEDDAAYQEEIKKNEEERNEEPLHKVRDIITEEEPLWVEGADSSLADGLSEEAGEKLDKMPESSLPEDEVILPNGSNMEEHLEEMERREKLAEEEANRERENDFERIAILHKVEDFQIEYEEEEEIIEAIELLREEVLKEEHLFEKRDEENLREDSDKDGISDYDEIVIFKTNPFKERTRGGEKTDAEKIISGINPVTDEPIEFEDPREVEPPVVRDYKVEKLLVRNSVDTIVPEDAYEEREELVLLFEGTALPNSFVTLYIYSTPIIITVKTDGNGKWEYELDRELEDGQHEMYVATVDNSGKIVAKSEPIPFVKTANAAELGTNLATAEETEVLAGSGYIIYMALAAIVGVMMMILLVGSDIRRVRLEEATLGENVNENSTET